MVDHLQDSSVFAPPLVAEVDGRPSRHVRAPASTQAEIFDLVYRQVRMLAGHRDVDELAQAAAEQAIRSLPSFEGRSALSTWTYRICYLTVRKHDRWYRRWLRRFTLTSDGELPERSVEAPSADDDLARSERASRLRAALMLISPKQRAVVILHDLEGLEIGAIADVVGANPIAVRSRLRDGRKSLARALASDSYFGDEACRREEVGR
jgi:RNA polymerase sigma-70 factor (ECF subfamily)